MIVDRLIISIHSLRVEGDQIHSCANFINFYFNPLPPCGGRPGCADGLLCRGDFNPLPPCGGRQLQNRQSVVIHEFQSTPSVWRETFWEYWKRGGTSYFNPLPPCGGRHVPTSLATLEKISIHSLRVEGDHAAALQCGIFARFQSTPSVWRETLLSCCNF